MPVSIPVGRTDHVVGREAERAGGGQPGAEQIQGQLSHAHKSGQDSVKGPDPPQQCPGKGLEAMAQTEI